MTQEQSGAAVNPAGLSDVGQRRSENEDSGYLSARMFVVADGIGGQPHGEVASATAATTMAELDASLPTDLLATDLTAALASGFVEAGRRIAALGERREEYATMGTTMVAMLTDGQRLALAHIGDSRAYRLRAGVLERLTADHTLAQSLADAGRISPEEVATHPRRSMLIRALQTGAPADPDAWLVDAADGDRYLICTDGLPDVIDDEALTELLSASADPYETVGGLIRAANEGGGPDNITCVVVDLAPAREIPHRRLLGAAADSEPPTEQLAVIDPGAFTE